MEVAMASKLKSAEEIRKEIEVRAYLIWESEGRPHGRQGEHWRRAEAEILGGKTLKKAPPAKKAAPAKKVAAAKPVAPAKSKRAAKAKKSEK
jgi:hypothetical protein